MDTLIESWEHAGLTCELHWEEDSSFADPREWENFGTMVCWHPDYNLGDFQFGSRRLENQFEYEPESMDDLYRYLHDEKKAVEILPLCIYDHSGITMYIGGKHDYPFDSAGWDTTFTGFIYATVEDQKRCGIKAKNVRKALRQEVEIYAAWLRGEVYWWCVRNDEDELMDSCGGYVGEDEYARQEANASAEALAKDMFVNMEPDFPEGIRA